jgi:hypothetical protein
MEQEPVIFSATILDPIGREPVAPLPPVVEEPREALDGAKDTIFEPLFVAPIAPPPLTRQCCLPSELEHPHERFERHSELADALPSIFIAFGIAYALGVLTGGMIFSSPSMIEAL